MYEGGEDVSSTIIINLTRSPSVRFYSGMYPIVNLKKLNPVFISVCLDSFLIQNELNV